MLGANSFQLSKYPAIQGGGPVNRFANRRDIDLPQAERFRDLMAGTGATVCLQLRRGSRQAVYLERQTNPNNQLYGTDENFLTARNYGIARGRNLTKEDNDYGRAVCLLGADTAARLFLASEEPVGCLIRIDGQSYRVVGVLAAKGTLFGQSQDFLVALPITRYLANYSRAGRSISINVQARTTSELEATMERAIGCMRLVRGRQPEDANDFEVFSNDSLIQAFDKIADVIANGAFVISLIALVAAGVGIMNIMLVSVTERTKEIGIRKSLGAQRRAILRQFLIEAVVIAQFGGLFGMLLGVVGGNVAASLMGASPTFPWIWIAVGFVFCTAIGVVFGFYPAWKAARLDPIEALRFE